MVKRQGGRSHCRQGYGSSHPRPPPLLHPPPSCRTHRQLLHFPPSLPLTASPPQPQRSRTTPAPLRPPLLLLGEASLPLSSLLLLLPYRRITTQIPTTITLPPLSHPLPPLPNPPHRSGIRFTRSTSILGFALRPQLVGSSSPVPLVSRPKVSESVSRVARKSSRWSVGVLLGRVARKRRRRRRRGGRR